jgi:nicotinamidase-related amidase
VLGGAICLVVFGTLAARGQPAATIVDEWTAVQPPPPPALRAVTVDPRTTAYLVLDVQQQSCNMQRRPRCVASIPRLQALLNRAIARGMPVIYSLTPGAAVTDIWWQVRPLGSEPVVATVADKFFGTDLERILRERGIRTVITVGTAAHGAVLYTASGAAMRGFQVIVPVDGMSAESLYIEQYTAWHLANAPTVGTRVTLTRTNQIQF